MTTTAAICHSLRTYYGPGCAAALDAFHARFLGPGELGFDVGSHVGDRSASFLRLGARALAVEPQPRLARLIRLLHGRTPGFTLVSTLVGAEPGTATLRVNSQNPTVASASADFIAAAAGAEGWEGQVWDTELTLPVTTLDALAAEHGAPDFLKIDVEGYEAVALSGLSRAPRSLSFEFTTIQRDIARICLERLSALGYRHFNACLGEGMAFTHPAPLSAEAMTHWIAALPHAANSGDVYASQEPARLTP
ncbi:FkbM family methyltransferase [Falsiroseomonas sp. E2-1-a4]|uniref:FkbM family methyltransferase n=1 Tax=Falsiroseomonas sp. E2-1-a4 TaxID=3239299 RepID=UPI003F2B3497